MNVHVISLFNKSTLLMVANCFSIELKEVGSESEATYHYSYAQSTGVIVVW